MFVLEIFFASLQGVLATSAAILVFIIFLIYRLRPKQYYFIRHGETILNKKHIKQGADGALTPKGVAQALLLGKVFADLQIQELCVSPYERAVETATLMQQSLKTKIIVTPLLAERKSPSEVLGKDTEDPEVTRITALTAYGYHENSYRYSDEENFEDLAARAKKCLSFLSHRPYQRIVVVTHHAFLQMLLSYLLYREDLTASTYVKLSFFNPAENGGVTTCVYKPWKFLSKTKGWEIVAYNQRAEES
ncbi:MAG: histidine phosphatase family protein [Candidatus Paceibacterota bacterium]